MARKSLGTRNACHGGKRDKAGRPPKSIKTKAMRVPVHLLDILNKLINDSESSVENQEYKLPLYTSKVSAGLGSTASDHIDTYINISQFLVSQPDATFCVRVSGDSMINAGINHNDIVIVDSSIPAKNGSIIVADLDSEMFVKRLDFNGSVVKLISENLNYEAITPKETFKVMGVVTCVLRRLLG